MKKQYNFGNTFLDKSYEERKQIIGKKKNPLEHYLIYMQHLVRYYPWKVEDFIPGKEFIINTFLKRRSGNKNGADKNINEVIIMNGYAYPRVNKIFDDYVSSPITFNGIKF